MNILKYQAERVPLSQPLIEMLREKLEEQHSPDDSCSVSSYDIEPAINKKQQFQTLLKKQQTTQVMDMLSLIKNQIVKFNVKKLFHLWAIYHPEDTNGQIVSQTIFKKNNHRQVNKIYEELLQKNQKLRSNVRLTRTLNISLQNTVDETTEKTTHQRRPRQTATTSMQKSTSFPICSVTTKTASLQLLRLLDNTGFSRNWLRLIDWNAYHAKKLPIIMCYTEYHINELIRICRTANRFPLYLLPSYLHKSVKELLRL